MGKHLTKETTELGKKTKTKCPYMEIQSLWVIKGISAEESGTADVEEMAHSRRRPLVLTEPVSASFPDRQAVLNVGEFMDNGFS